MLRGWVRATVAPAMYAERYVGQLNTIIKDQDAQLQHPFQLLGMRSAGGYPAQCSLDTAQGIRIVIYCDAIQNGFRHIHTTAELASFSRQVQVVHRLLIANGWRGGSEGTLISPPASLTPPIGGYSYGKITHGFNCTFQFGSGDMGGLDGGGLRATLLCSRVGRFL